MAATKKPKIKFTKLEEFVTTYPDVATAVLEKLKANLQDPSTIIHRLTVTQDHFSIELMHIEKGSCKS